METRARGEFPDADGLHHVRAWRAAKPAEGAFAAAYFTIPSTVWRVTAW